MNKVILLGNLGKDPETKTTQSGKAVAEFSVATKGFKDTTDWHNVQAWDKTAQLVAEYLRKGSQVLVEGRLKTDSYESNGTKKYITRVVADRVQFLSKREDVPVVTTDEIPF